jgi:GAF domain-containing protein/DNA-binding NarL/FixJ family response regulator
MTDFKKYSILVVEDDLGWQEIYKNILGSAGYDVKTARNYQEAIDIIRKNNFDVAIIDIVLDNEDDKNVDGLRVLAQISKLENKPQPILATAYPENFKGLEDYAYAVWEKGSGDQNVLLLSKIKQALNEKENISPTIIKRTLHTIIGKMAREKLSLEEVCKLILREMAELIKANLANLSLVQENKLFVIAATTNEFGKDFDIEDSISGLAIKWQKTVYIPDISADERAATLFKPALGKNIKSELVVPLMIGVEPIAVLNFESDNKNAFSESDIELLEELAGQVAIVINSARLQDQTNTVKRLSEISSEINAGIDRGEMGVAGIAVEKLLEFMKCTKAAVFNYDADRSKIDFLAHRGLSDEYIRSDFSLDSPRTLITQTKQPVIISDIANDERFILVRELAKEEGIRALIELPLLIKSKMFGSIVAYYDNFHNFEVEELALAKLFADHVAVAMSNAKQYEALQDAKEREKMAAIGAMTGDIVHRMNSPLGAIRANVQLIFMKCKDDVNKNSALNGYLNKIHSIADQATNMVEEMKAKAIMEALRPIECNNIINMALASAEMPADIMFEDKTKSIQLPEIMGKEQLSKVFLNLISNGIEAIKNKNDVIRKGDKFLKSLIENLENLRNTQSSVNKIILNAKIIDNEWVDITVEDTGIGIPSDWKDDIFDMLSVFSKKRGDSRGHGLGLWYSKAFVEACGGELPAPYSEVGKGTKFTVRLKIANHLVNKGETNA